MSPSDKRDWSGLLYLPAEELVRSTIDGDDADWSESVSYVPADAVVRAVLDASERERPTIRLPATVLPPRVARGASTRKRWTAALLAGLGFSPFSLAAAAVAHLTFLLAIGPWILTQASAVRSIQFPRSRAIVATRLVYFVPPIGNATRIATLRKQPARTTTQPPLDTANSGAASTVRRLPLDSAASPSPRFTERPVPEREVIGALSQELRYVRDGFELEPGDRPKLELIVRILTTRPELRIRVLGAAPPPRERGLPGMAEAEAMKRTLIQAGIAPERIDIEQMPESERQCSEREPDCAAARRRVRTMAAGFAAERPNRRPD